MAVLSSLRTIESRTKLVRKLVKNYAFNQIRQEHWERSFHGRRMNIVPSLYQWYKFKNLASFYVALGVIPLAILTTLVNIFIGNAELAEIPEGYVPERWEFYKSPITRAIAWFNRDPRMNHEMIMARINEEGERKILNDIEASVKFVMQFNNDYQSWFYTPVYGKYHRLNRAEMKLFRDKIEGRHSDVGTEWKFRDLGDPNPRPQQ